MRKDQQERIKTAYLNLITAKEEKITTSVSIEEKLLTKIDQIASVTNRDRSYVICLFLKEALSALENEYYGER